MKVQSNGYELIGQVELPLGQTLPLFQHPKDRVHPVTTLEEAILPPSKPNA